MTADSKPSRLCLCSSRGVFPRAPLPLVEAPPPLVDVAAAYPELACCKQASKGRGRLGFCFLLKEVRFSRHEQAQLRR